jgi:hypothetical protein
LNMPNMVVTLDVSKLSGWLKKSAPCRVERRACDAGGERGGSREAGGPVVLWGHDKRGMHGDGSTQGLRARARAERTANMSLMSVTLEVSKLSGWLKVNLLIPVCRASQGEAHTMWGARCVPGGGGV